MLKQVTLTLLFILFLVPSVMALNVPSAQEKITLTLERGFEHVHNLQLKNLTEITDFSITGNASEWVTFGSDYSETYQVTNLVDQGLRINIFVPSSASIKHYQAVIKANDDTVTIFYIKVVDTFEESLDDMQSQVTGLKSQITKLRDQQTTMESRINEVKAGQRDTGETTENVEGIVEELRLTLNEVKSFQEDLKMWKNDFDDQKVQLESKIKNLENETTYLQDKNQELNNLTGALTFQGTSLGLLLVIVVVGFLYFSYAGAPSFGGSRPKFRFNRNKTPKFKAPNHDDKKGSALGGLLDPSRFKLELKAKEDSSASKEDSSASVRNFPKPKFSNSDFKYKYRPR